MVNEQVLHEEKTLDPADWSALNALGHRMVDDMFEYLQSLRSRPVYKKTDAAAVNSMQQPLPITGADAQTVYEEFLQYILPYNKNNIHPRFWSWVEGGGTPFGMLADMLASGMNPNVALGDHMPMYVDRQVVEWSKQMMGFPPTASGLLVSGASMANITALVVARNQFHRDIRKQGMRAVPGQMILYGSSETHNCVAKGIEVIGIGSDNFRKIAVDDHFRINTDALRKAIAEDRAAGNFPFCIIGNAGTVNTGAIDPLEELAAIAKEEGCWLHIDGAFGAIPSILPEFAQLRNGLALADSLSFDYHKWLYVNYEVGCVLVRDGSLHRDSFATTVNYLIHHERGLSSGPESTANFGMELSRSFKALKIWMLLKEHGLQTYMDLVRQNLRQAQYLGSLVKQTPHLELLADVSLNIVCYRFNPGNISEDALNRLNKEILMRLQEQGIAAPSYTLLNNKYAIRAAICNHRSRMEDFEVLVRETVRIGNECLPEA